MFLHQRNRNARSRKIGASKHPKFCAFIKRQPNDCNREARSFFDINSFDQCLLHTNCFKCTEEAQFHRTLVQQNYLRLLKKADLLG